MNSTLPSHAPVVLAGDFGRREFGTTAPVLQAHLLGPLRVVVDGEAVVEWPGGRARGVLEVLLVEPWRPVPREVLMATFWPERDAAAARNNLNVAVHGLRRALARHAPGHAFVEHRRGCYALGHAVATWTDVQAFEQALAQARAAHAAGQAAARRCALQAAVDLYGGELLADERYESWCVPRRRQLHDAALRAAGQLAEVLWSAGELSACVSVLQRLLALDACDEAAHRMLMRCHQRLEQSHLAVRQYHVCVEVLQRELRMIPSPQTVALHREIRGRLAA